MLKAYVFASVAVLSVMVLPVKSLAHVMETNYVMQDTKLKITAVYSSGEPARNTHIKVYAPNNLDQPWMEGVTDENGNFAFQPDPNVQGEWEVKIGENDHADELLVPVTDQGVQIDKISQLPNEGHLHIGDRLIVDRSGISLAQQPQQFLHNPTQQLLAPGALVLSGSLCTTALITRRQR
jgi:nickel transport protein